MVDIDRVVHDRDADGELKPETVYVEEFDVPGEDDPTVDAKPLTNDDQEKYIQPFIEAVSVASAITRNEVDMDDLDEEAKEELQSMGQDALSDHKLAEMFDEKIVEPDLLAGYQATYPDRDIEALDEDFIKFELRTGAKDGLFFAILLASEMDDLVAALRSAGEADRDGEGEDGEGEAAEAGNA